MLKPSLLITLVIALLTASIWYLLSDAKEEPPWPQRIQGFSFSPVQAGQDPSQGSYPTVEEIRRDLRLIADKTYAVRTYSVESTFAEIPRLAQEEGLNVALGAWISGIEERDQAELRHLIELARRYHKNVVRVIVGNEAILRKEVTVKEAIANLDFVRSQVWAPISLAEPWHVWLEHPELAEHVDYIAAHILPYWEGIPLDGAIDFALEKYHALQQRFPNKPIVIAEVGWPSNGRPLGAAKASQANQASFLRRFLKVAGEEGWVYYVMEAFDQPWKKGLEGDIGSYWGVYDVWRKPKFTFTEAVVSIPQWRELAAISILFGLMVLLLLFRDSEGLKSSGRGFLALVAYGSATGAVWMFYDYTRQYMSLSHVVVGVVLFIGSLGVLVVMFAEAHEWAESLWMRQWRRMPKPQPLVESSLPMVSIHVPAYNEPAPMMIESLDALARLDYPNFEVLVIDNNTRDPEVWQPVERHCAMLGERFRFFHRSPLTGFKAGALNFTLGETHPEALVVAVIDSDYQVSPNWLRDLVPQFLRKPEVAVVQAPQDYRDGGESCFKAMCLAEYRGFFHIGMITRNERNAIIQHGTMTMVRRSALEEVGGWGEWCITEDADLGLRVFEQGYEAIYVPRSYGQGLMPDTFVDFKKQRFRWAYGAVQIIKHHLGHLFGVRQNRLTSGQRYHFIAGWLPWFADGFNLFFNLAAIGWTVAMVLMPTHFDAPLPLFAVLPLTLFLFKLVKMFFLYRRRVSATIRQSIAAALAGLALSHTIARAIVQGLFTRGLPFFRTPKQAHSTGLLRAIADAREEVLFLLALCLAAGTVYVTQGERLPDARIWSMVLLLQSIPYASTLLVSVVSAFPRLPARIVGVMGAMPGDDKQKPRVGPVPPAGDAASVSVEVKSGSSQ